MFFSLFFFAISALSAAVDMSLFSTEQSFRAVANLAKQEEAPNSVAEVNDLNVLSVEKNNRTWIVAPELEQPSLQVVIDHINAPQSVRGNQRIICLQGLALRGMVVLQKDGIEQLKEFFSLPASAPCFISFTPPVPAKEVFSTTEFLTDMELNDFLKTLLSSGDNASYQSDFSVVSDISAGEHCDDMDMPVLESPHLFSLIETDTSSLDKPQPVEDLIIESDSANEEEEDVKSPIEAVTVKSKSTEEEKLLTLWKKSACKKPLAESENTKEKNLQNEVKHFIEQRRFPIFDVALVKRFFEKMDDSDSVFTRQYSFYTRFISSLSALFSQNNQNVSIDLLVPTSSPFVQGVLQVQITQPNFFYLDPLNSPALLLTDYYLLNNSKQSFSKTSIEFFKFAIKSLLDTIAYMHEQGITSFEVVRNSMTDHILRLLSGHIILPCDYTRI